MAKAAAAAEAAIKAVQTAAKKLESVQSTMADGQKRELLAAVGELVKVLPAQGEEEDVLVDNHELVERLKKSQRLNYAAKQTLEKVQLEVGKIHGQRIGDAAKQVGETLALYELDQAWQKLPELTKQKQLAESKAGQAKVDYDALMDDVLADSNDEEAALAAAQTALTEATQQLDAARATIEKAKEDPDGPEPEHHACVYQLEPHATGGVAPPVAEMAPTAQELDNLEASMSADGQTKASKPAASPAKAKAEAAFMQALKNMAAKQGGEDVKSASKKERKQDREGVKALLKAVGAAAKELGTAHSCSDSALDELAEGTWSRENLEWSALMKLS